MKFLSMLAIAAAVQAAGDSPMTVSETAPAGPTIDQIVHARKAAMTMSVFALGDLKLKAEKGAPASEQAFIARSLANWANALPGMFPPGTAGTNNPFDTHARPEIWTQWPAFARCAFDYIEKTQKLRDLASAGTDPAGVMMQIDLVGRSCNGCHESFRFNPHDSQQGK